MAPVNKRSGVTWVVQDLQDPTLMERTEDQATLVDTATDAARKLEAFAPKSIMHGMSGACPTESLENQPHTRLDPRIRIECDSAGRVVGETDRQRKFQSS